jgi:DNA-binding transcriptional MocR family regulator
MNKQRITQTDLPPGFIDLGSGNPDLELFPLELLRSASEEYFSLGDPQTLQYGAEEGSGYFLEALAGYLTTTYKTDVAPHSLFTTTGASSALDLLCALRTRPGDVVFIEEPTYFLALRIFEDHGLQVIPIPMDESGLRVDMLDEILAKHQPKFIYSVPTFHNPSGRTLPQARRNKLVQLAQKHNFLIIADEVYHLLSYSQAPPHPFAVFSDEVEQVVSINSFSKILAPGLRLGWLHAHRILRRQLIECGLLDSGGGMNPFTSAIVRFLIDSGDLASNIISLQETYLERRNALVSALDRYLPEAEFRKPHGGFFIWVRLPGVNTSLLRRSVKEFDVDFRPGELFSSRNELKEYMRLSFSHYNPEEIEEGVLKLSRCLKQDR